MNKKSQGLSINLIIIVAIALIILVVVIAIFTGRMGDFMGGVQEQKTCLSACAGLNKVPETDSKETELCSGGQKLPGTYDDVDNCCCKQPT